MKPKAIDLFAGPGGLSLGLIEAGFDVIAAIEYDEAAGRTYKQNIGNHVFPRDIRKLPPSEMKKALGAKGSLQKGEDLALIAGGPPCPGFSLIGRSKISDLIEKGQFQASEDPRVKFLADDRNLLFEEFVSYVNAFKPRYFIMENVQGMESFEYQDEDSIIEHIKSRFRGYEVSEKVLCASDYGVPQDRNRIIFLGYHKKKANPISFEEVEKGRVSKKLTARDAIVDLSRAEPSDSGIVRVRDPGGGRLGKNFRRMMRDWEVWDDKKQERVRSTGGRKTNHISRKPNARDMVLFPLIESGSERFKEDERGTTWDGKRVVYGDLYDGSDSKWDNLAKKFKEAGLSVSTEEVDGKMRHFVEKLGVRKWIMYPSKGESGEGKFVDKFRRMKWDEPSPTIMAHLAKDGYMFIHPWLNRTISVREAARLQSFPDSFDFQKGGGNSKSDMFRQVGNAVPPLLAKAIGETIMEALGNSSD